MKNEVYLKITLIRSSKCQSMLGKMGGLGPDVMSLQNYNPLLKMTSEMICHLALKAFKW